MKKFLVLSLLLALSGCSFFSKGEVKSEEAQVEDTVTEEVTLPDPPSILRSEEQSEPATEPEVEPATEPELEPAQEPATEPEVEPAQEPATEPEVEPAQEPATEPEVEPAQEPATEPEVEPATEPEVEPAQEPVEQVLSPVSFNLKASNFAYSQSSLTVKEGQEVTINLDITEGFHDIKIDGVVQTQASGEGTSQVAKFTAPKKGTYEFYCSVGSHRSMGMVGTLIVE
jgi:plastocyanin